MGAQDTDVVEQLAPGAQISVRGEEWLVRDVARTNHDGDKIRAIGVSEFVLDHEATFFTAIEQVTPLLPEATELVTDDSPQFRRSRLFPIGVAAPTRDMVEELTHELNRARLRAVEIGREGPHTSEAVRVGTMHRCKGLEFQHMCVAGVSDGLVPRSQRAASTQRAERQRQRERSLLFVASTRARDTLVITHHGEPSRFLYPLIATQPAA